MLEAIRRWLKKYPPSPYVEDFPKGATNFGISIKTYQKYKDGK